MDQPIEDQTYKQALKHLAHRLEKEALPALTESCEKFFSGSSLEESTAWIQTEQLRKAVRNRLIPMAIEVYLTSMKGHDFLEESTREEMIAYLRNILQRTPPASDQSVL